MTLKWTRKKPQKVVSDMWRPIETCPLLVNGEVPSHSEYYLLYDEKTGHIDLGNYCFIGKYWSAGDGPITPTHWRELPDPPGDVVKEQKKNTNLTPEEYATQILFTDLSTAQVAAVIRAAVRAKCAEIAAELQALGKEALTRAKHIRVIRGSPVGTTMRTVSVTGSRKPRR